jgi:hypothetical protein
MSHMAMLVLITHQRVVVAGSHPLTSKDSLDVGRASRRFSCLVPVQKHADELVGTDMVLGTWKHPELASQPGWWGESALEE